MMRFVVALLFLGINFYTYHFLGSNPAPLPERKPFAAFPLEYGEWACPKRQEMEPAVIRNLGVTDYLICDFRRMDPLAVVSVYIGYHGSQVREEGGGASENSIHPPAHCLPGSGWDVISAETVEIEAPGLPGGRAQVKRMLIAKGKQRSLVYYWYQSRGRAIAEDWQKVLYVGLDRAFRGRTDGSLVRFTIPVVRGDDARADQDFFELAPRVLAEIDQYVPE